ncbi:hypothetical protein OHA25_07885 [Nonomuraea sp. NBC_00507]|uniref:hypothetical protein n=1 Tax=Nonomuraea sp. NBC_00507 TaxID=2976002 RepID=UPI002E188C01
MSKKLAGTVLTVMISLTGWTLASAAAADSTSHPASGTDSQHVTTVNYWPFD